MSDLPLVSNSVEIIYDSYNRHMRMESGDQSLYSLNRDCSPECPLRRSLVANHAIQQEEFLGCGGDKKRPYIWTEESVRVNDKQYELCAKQAVSSYNQSTMERRYCCLRNGLLSQW